MPIPVNTGLVIVGDTVAGRCGHRDRLERFREPEVQHLHHPVGPQLDVGRLQIAVNDALLVCDLERFRDLPRDRQCFVERHP